MTKILSLYFKDGIQMNFSDWIADIFILILTKL